MKDEEQQGAGEGEVDGAGRGSLFRVHRTEDVVMQEEIVEDDEGGGGNDGDYIGCFSDVKPLTVCIVMMPDRSPC